MTKATKARAIQFPVGRQGLNRAEDVGIIQKLLNRALEQESKFAATGLAKLKADRQCGPRTIEAITKFQEKVLGWSGPAVDGTVHPSKKTWKALNGNVPSTAHIKPKATTRAAWVGGYATFRQGDYQDKLGFGKATSQSIARYGCALCTLTMAATCIGGPTQYWPDGLLPRDLTPPQANQILRKAGAFSGFLLTMAKAAGALGMIYEEYGKQSDLSPDDLQKIDDHLGQGLPVAANVDYKKGSEGDHWILLISRSCNETYTAIDPAYGRTVFLTSGRYQTVNNVRYAQTKDERTGVLFGWIGSGGSKNQEKYIVVRFALLTPQGGVCQ